MFEISKILEKENICEGFFEKYDYQKSIILFGSGGGCLESLQMFKEHNIYPKAICDNNSMLWGKKLDNIEIMSFEKALKKFNDFFVFISAPCFAEEIKEYLKYKISEDRIIFFGNDKRINISDYKKYLKANEKYLIKLYNTFEDEKSKKTFKNFLYGWVSCDYNYFSEIATKKQYFQDDIFDFTKNEVFVDVGAYTGDSTEEFILYTKGDYGKIYMVEPNENNILKLENIKKNYPNIFIINKGAYNCNREMKFENENVFNQESAHLVISSKVNSSKMIRVDKIDNMIKESVTFIKMDIEGVEYAALQGAINTINKYKPKLAICVYHKVEDIIEISKFIMSLNKGYKLYLRHHSSFFAETVLYAI